MNEFFKRHTQLWLIPAFLLCFLVVGLPYWQTPYSKVSLPSTLLGMGPLAIVVVAAAIRALGKTSFILTLLALGASVPVAVMLRVAVETSQDPTSHNLWPFEVVIASVLGFGCSLAGTLLGSIPALLSRKSGLS